ncbi:hypothetical protein GmHk_05G012720 [Glycine max]|nr:hypothetical protein GmHk_05G012720 [Glycine max]
MSRTKKFGQMTSEAAKEIVDRIDILTVAIGRPEHPGCVRITRASVTIKQYFGAASRSSRTSVSMAPEDLEQLTQKIRDQLEEWITEKGLALPLELEVGPSAARVSTKKSCVDPSRQDLDTGDSEKCGLYVNDNRPCLVALGRVYEGSTTVHNIPLGNYQVKIGVEEDEQGAKGLTKLADRSDPDVSWDSTAFGVYKEKFPLYIKHKDLSEIAHSGQCLNISVIQLWILHITKTSMQARNASMYGFLEPQFI